MDSCRACDAPGAMWTRAYLAMVRIWPRISPPGEMFVWTLA